MTLIIFAVINYKATTTVTHAVENKYGRLLKRTRPGSDMDEKGRKEYIFSQMRDENGGVRGRKRSDRKRRIKSGRASISLSPLLSIIFSH